MGSLPSSTTGITVGVPAYWVVLHRPAAAAQFLAKVQVGLLVFWILTWPFTEVITAVSPAWVNSMH